MDCETLLRFRGLAVDKNYRRRNRQMLLSHKHFKPISNWSQMQLMGKSQYRSKVEDICAKTFVARNGRPSNYFFWGGGHAQHLYASSATMFEAWRCYPCQRVTKTRIGNGPFLMNME
jgi:hypothetical protein